MLEVGRRVAHERCPDGSHIAHPSPCGGKATLVNDILWNLSPSSFQFRPVAFRSACYVTTVRYDCEATFARETFWRLEFSTWSLHQLDFVGADDPDGCRIVQSLVEPEPVGERCPSVDARRMVRLVRFAIDGGANECARVTAVD